MIWMDVDAALSEVPVNVAALIDDTDFKTREESVVYNQAGMDLVWNFVTTAGAMTQTAVTPTTAGVHDWTSQLNGMYSLEIPASAGTINNDTEGFGWFTGFATGILPWRGPIIGFRAAGLNNVLIDTAYSATRGLAGTAVPDAAADAAGGLPISDAGGLDMDDIPITSEFEARTIAAAAYFDPAADAVANVTLVDTTTTNTDVRGTDSALLASTFSTMFAGITALAEWLGLIAGKQTGDATARTELRATGAGSGTFDETADSLEAIRDRGDTAWITGGGGGITDILNMQPVLPTSIDLANTAVVRLGLILTNALDDLPSTAEITPGTISIDRKAIGGTSWSSVVSDSAMSEQAGMVYFDEVFDSGTGYAEGDSIRVTFKSVKITVAANDYEICDANGIIFQTEIRQTMRGTDGANTTVPATEAQLNARTLVAADYFDPAADTVANVTTTAAVTDKAGFSLSATGLDLILSTSTAFIAIAKAVWDTILTGFLTNNSAGKLLRQVAEIVQAEGTIVDASATTTVFETNLTAVDSFYSDSLIKFLDGALAGQVRPILSYAQTNGQITLDEGTTSAVANGVSFQILADHVHPVTQIAAAVWAILTSTLTTAGTIGKALVDGLAKLGTPAADISADIAAVKVDTDAVKTKTDNLTFTKAGEVDANAKSINDTTVNGTGVLGDEWGP